MGGKNRLAKWIIPHFPPHRTYVEAFAGSAGVLLRKPISKKEIYNDKWDDVVHLFLTLRDQGDELKQRLTYMPASHALFNKYAKKWRERDFDDDVDRAITVFYVMNLSYAGLLDYNWVCRREREVARILKRKVDVLNQFTERMRGVLIENLDFRDVIKEYDAEDTLFYCDPPYKIDKEYYYHGFSKKDHYDLAEVLSNVEGFAALSYYGCEEIRELYPEEDWWYNEKELVKQSATVEKGEKKPVGIELLITNYEPPKIELHPDAKAILDVFK